MVRRIPSQVHKQASRLLQAEYITEKPRWFQAVLDHPPLPLPARATPPRSEHDLPPVRGSRPKVKRTPGPRVLPIFYLEDEIRRNFFRDHPFEAFRPVSLTEGATLEDAHPIRGLQWTRLRQRGRNPSSEDCIRFTLNLHEHHQVPLSKAYGMAVSQFRALRSEQHIATQVAALEGEVHGTVFGPTQTESGFDKETEALGTWKKREENDLGAIAARKRWRAIIQREGGPGDWTKGEQYTRLWKEGVRPNYSSVVTAPEITPEGLSVQETLSDFMDIVDRKRAA
ncbi:hypothetical protein JAAARDRAFT_147601 [Jaapia argillacea MUCL 33604]|uniref:Small ribosomal subunit protein mS23 n=1 Tax=Jaapia argillacea MUCL 33604 TaxID=933084 RepID=A0A067Q8P6_9AGAM|nr:hypothetical protein JAAARDRAFT_147601 [Jaapia argillacea MUCL 33604]